MTKEEAIKNLLEMRDGMPFDKCQDWIDATSMAIRSLEAWDNLEEEMAEEIYSYDAFPDIWYGISEAYDIVKKYSKEVQGE